MEEITSEEWQVYSEVFAFVGNSLMKPISQTPQVGLDPAFWEGFPDFNNQMIADAAHSLSDFAKRVGQDFDIDPVTDVSVEYTHLFVGPPEPAAGPWETLYRGEKTHVGFGQATSEMRQLLRSSGLRLQNENNQYEDHMGIELLYLSVLCGRMADSSIDMKRERAEQERIKFFMEEHPLDWVGEFRRAIQADSPDGYYDRMLNLVDALLNDLHRRLV